MLLTPEETHFDFHGAKLDPVHDRDTIAWAVQQFLYGEMTGIQVGHWIYGAPDLEAARFLSKQAVEEFQHVGNFLRILDILGVKPAPAHPIVRFLSTGMMGGGWEEHVALEMAVGEGLVLQAFYAMIQLIDHDEIVAILKRGVRQEESHVDFGERRTMKTLQEKPWMRERLLGLALVSVFMSRRLGEFMKKALPSDHPALKQLPEFVQHTVSVTELRLQRMGLIDRPLSQVSSLEQARLVAGAYAGKAAEGVTDRLKAPLRVLPWFAPKRLTDTYLDDPIVRNLQWAGKKTNTRHMDAEPTSDEIVSDATAAE
ncbi:MAG: ferritin-like domain-containing protein [Polyangiaceae bacterium]